MKSLFLSICILILSAPANLSAQIRILTKDKLEIICEGVEELALLQSKTIKNILEDFEQGGDKENPIPLPEISQKTLKALINCLVILHESKAFEAEKKTDQERHLMDILSNYSADELFDLINAASYLSAQEFLDRACKIWCDKQYFSSFENSTHEFRNIEIVQKLKECLSSSIKPFFIKQFFKKYSPLKVRTLNHAHNFSSVYFNHDGKKVVAGSWDGKAFIWDVGTGQLLHLLQGHEKLINSVCFNHDGSQVATGSADDTICIWNADTGDLLHRLTGHRGSVTSICFSPDGDQLATSSIDKCIFIWDAATGNQLRAFQGHQNMVSSVCYNPEGSQLITGSFDDTARIWDIPTGELLHTLKGHKGSVAAVCYSPDGIQVVTGSDDFTARVWDPVTGQLLHKLEGHQKSIKSLCYSPDGNILVTASSDSTLRMWDAVTGDLLQIFPAHERSLSSVSYSPNGNHLASASCDHTVCLWDVAGQVQGLPQMSYEQLILYGLCKKGVEEGKEVNLKSKPNLLKIFNSLTLRNQEFLYKTTLMGLPSQTSLMFKLYANKRRIAVASLTSLALYGLGSL